ncbi:Phosphoglycerate mutase-like protein 1 [Glycine max]|nr:Phosphoglycerate mutase-like protein 1 [Glycine max]
MDYSAGSSLFPLHRCKTIHLVRHAQGIHNVEGDKNYKAYMNPDYFDAHLTPLGWQQVDNLRKHVRDSGLINTIDLVIASPLMRTLQTTVGVFGGEGYTDKTDVLPLMVANAGNSYRAAISSLNSPPIVTVELCREHLYIGIWGMVLTNLPMFSSCREFIPVTEEEVLASINFFFPLLIFHWQVLRLQMPECFLFKFLFQLDSDEDTWWKANVRETKEELAARGMKFLNWLWTRKEKEIAIVTHSGFLFHTLNAFGSDCHPLVKKEISKHFANCELRSMVIVDRGMIGLEQSTTNYPGKIPSGLDLPSDVADEKSEK